MTKGLHGSFLSIIYASHCYKYYSYTMFFYELTADTVISNLIFLEIVQLEHNVKYYCFKYKLNYVDILRCNISIFHSYPVN